MTVRTEHDPGVIRGEFVRLDDEEVYRISNYHRMSPFLMNITSDTDLWMYVTSNGGLTAGRVDADGSLFPYETVDRLLDAHHHTGPTTLIRAHQTRGQDVLWEPFSTVPVDDSQIERNLYKNTIGNQLIFEEIHHQLELAFRYRWKSSDTFGWVRTAVLRNCGNQTAFVSLLDGLRNVLPFGAPLSLYQGKSCLVDAYKRTECDSETGLGIFSLTAQIVDRAEAAEELRANTVWCHGLRRFDVRLSIEDVVAFRQGVLPPAEHVLTGRRGNYLLTASLELQPSARVKWHLVADVAQDHMRVSKLRARLLQGGDLDSEIERSLQDASENLLRIVGSADGLQFTGHEEASAHHAANVLFNNMRGGVFVCNNEVPTADLRAFIQARNWRVADRNAAFLGELPAEVPVHDLHAAAEAHGDVDLRRLCHEYLPLYFGRRHGDPSRPWNRFTIRVKNTDGSRALRYEGNWRDIFQNWEALSQSFPGFLPNVIAKFVNASTVDGFNPYRITRDGVDWEVVDRRDPWSYIGYWGDHQIVYLLRLLEMLHRFSPVAIDNLLSQEIFCYAQVPYRLKPYEDILKNPQTTVLYDFDLAVRIERRVEDAGHDGKLLVDRLGLVYHVNLLEKLVVPALSKLSNLVIDGGIWMNTQRPEWNDANNALVGNGLSVVTVCYLRRYVSFLSEILVRRSDITASVSKEVVDWLQHLHAIFRHHMARLHTASWQDTDRREFLDAVGSAFSHYRDVVYRNGFSGKTTLKTGEILDFCYDALRLLDHTIQANRREDGLFHSYNLLDAKSDPNEARVSALYEMLEGQVAAMGSGLVDASEAEQLLTRLFDSRLYRKDQRSFLLYPQRELPAFLQKNVIPKERVQHVALLKRLHKAGDSSILVRDLQGVFRFSADFHNAHDLATALDDLAQDEAWRQLVNDDRQAVLAVFEEVFNHRSFTGRSGTMYAYEGLGCIYWHMVSKLLLAVQEIALRAAREGQSKEAFEALGKTYYRIRAGLGFEKSAQEYGAFPTDPYSHTPPHAGAQQPGMTGQVKEEILTRMGELGVTVESGLLGFRPVLLRRREFCRQAGAFRYYDAAGTPQSLSVPMGGLAFTFCQVPVIYELTQGKLGIHVTRSNGTVSSWQGDQLDAVDSRAVFNRLGTISKIKLELPERALFQP